MIVAHDVTRRFGRNTAVDHVSFALAEGGGLALWGSNGAGKTTLIRCLLGVIRFRGSARIRGVDVATAGRAARALVGYVPQELAFHDDVRLGAVMAFFAAIRRTSSAVAAESLAAMGLGGHENKRVRDLSGGMKQRLALAIATLGNPPLIILDEPTSNLDAAGRQEVVDALKRLRASGKTLVFASHRPDEVAALADRVLVLENGAIRSDTTPGALWPADRPNQVLRLHIPESQQSAAADALRQAGLTVQWNGHGFCVLARRDSKVEPLAELLRRCIDVSDFDLIDGTGQLEGRQ